jgi:diguanylate cyclase (GGDEF)-like protein/PAS domain S-box-containing protein
MTNTPRKTDDPELDPVVDLDSIAAQDIDPSPVVDLKSIVFTEPKKQSPLRLTAVRVNAPDLLIIARVVLPVLVLLYFYFIVLHPLLPLPAILACFAFFLGYHLFLYNRTKQHGYKNKYIMASIQLDIAASHFAWLCDPTEPTPMLLVVLIAVIGNGIQHGMQSFRSLLQITAILAPLVLALRLFVISMVPSSYLFLFLSFFLLIYIYFLIERIDAIQVQAEKRTTELELSNFKLQQLGIAIQNSEARYRNIFDNSNVAMVLIEDNMRISLVNSKFEELTQYNKSELYNKKRLTDFIDTEDLERIKRYHAKRKLKGGAAPIEYQCKILDKNQKIKHVIIRFNVVPWHERIMATMVDITSSEQAKAALHRSTRKLRQAAALLAANEKRYRGLFENTGTATILVEKNMRISMANSKFCEMTGFTKDVITQQKRLSEFIERKNLYRIRKFHAKQKAKGLPLPTEYECLIVDKQKHLKHVVMKIYTQPGQENSIVSFFDITKRKEAEAALQEAHEKLRIVAVMDELTQVANRRQFNEKLNREWNRLRREGLPLSLIMCDVDCFKLYNDNYGHQKGDRCLRSIADAIKQNVKRSIDVVARYGGEEFAVIMPNTDVDGALHVAENMRAVIEQLKIPNKASTVSPYITLSLGISTMIPTSAQPPDALIKDADNALYEAKRLGRNRTVLGKCFQAESLQQVLRWDSNKPMAF